MKIAWFTPFNTNSAIGQVGRLVCEELQKTVSVDIWTFNRENVIQTSVPVVYFDFRQLDGGKLQQYDYIVYNMGNYAGNHGEIWRVMQKRPGVLLLHDQLMQNFFSQIAIMPEFGGNPDTGESEYLRLMRACYGARGGSAGKALYKPYFWEGAVRLWDSESALTYPLFEPLFDRATAVFTHASFFAGKIRDHFYGPVSHAYLPHLSPPDKKNMDIPPEFDNRGKSLVVSNGIVHPVKRIGRVAEMLLKNPDIAKRVQYVVIGGYGGPYGEYLNSLAEGPLRGCLYLLGYQSDDIMEGFLRKADFCVNLRYPNSEVCSKSLIEQMAFENPVVVLNSGIYGELPDDCVVKINLENEIPELESAFRLLLDNKSTRLEIGGRAADFVEKYCTPQEYASRFMTFLESIPQTILMNKVINDTIRINQSALIDLAFNQQNAPGVVDATLRQLNNVCNAINSKPDNEKVLGIWLGFPYALSLRREGITRFLLYMLMAMLERYPIKCELWTYSFNENEVRASFGAVLTENDFKNRIKVVTEKNFEEVLNLPSYKRNIPRELNEVRDNLAEVAREFSNASSFVTAIVYLDNVIGTGKPLFVPVHDLSIHIHYDNFVAKDPLYKARFVDIRSRAEDLARAGAFMFSNSEFVRQGHVLKHVSSINEKRTAVVYLPVNIPKDINKNLLSEKDIREKFRLTKPYIFYPTQVRPYKNVSILVEALSILKNKNLDIELVLTGNPSDVPEVEMAMNRLKIRDKIVCLSSVTESELYSLYRYAAVAAVPTLFEGGFPWQACEALFMDTPLVLSNIPIVKERIESTGMTLENCGILLFDPSDPLACALAMEEAFSDRNKTLFSQMEFKNRLLSYSWHDAVEKYYNIFFEDQAAGKNIKI